MAKAMDKARALRGGQNLAADCSAFTRSGQALRLTDVLPIWAGGNVLLLARGLQG
jgi:hypothetical protein